VVDILIIGFSTLLIIVVKRIMHDRFLMMDMGPLHYFLSLNISRDASRINISQAKYVQDLLELFHMIDYKSASTPFLAWVRLEDGRDTPLVYNTLYKQIVGIFCISPTPDQTYHMQWEKSPSTCKSHMSYTGRLQSVSFSTFRAPSTMGFIMH
jgi:hypothetical protein